MPKKALTTKAIEAIKPPPAGQVDHFDKGYPGLALRVSYGGRKSWTFFYRIYGKQRRLTFGTWPVMNLAAARKAWQDARTAIADGKDPAKPKPELADTFAAICEQWLKRDQGGNRSVDRVRRALERNVLPEWGERQIATIDRRAVNEVLDTIMDRGAIIQARRVHAYLHRLFRWSVGRGIIEVNPLADLPRPGSENPRDRVLSDVELVSVWNAAETLGWPFGPATQLLILTGARVRQIGALTWAEVNGGTIHLAKERCKNNVAFDIPLAPAAVEILDKLPRIAGSDFVFTPTGVTPILGWSGAKKRLDAAMVVEPWRLHDLRRTLATGMQKLGERLEVIEEVLGHSSGSRSGIVAVYQKHSFDKEKRIALDKWAAHIHHLVSGEAAKVVAFPGA